MSARCFAITPFVCGLLLPVAFAQVASRATQPSAATKPASFSPTEELLYRGDLARGEEVLAAQLKKNPQDDEARFALGITQLLRGIERMTQSLRRFGPRIHPELGMLLGMLDGGTLSGLPSLQNPAPEPISYDDMRKIIENWVDDLERVNITLGGIKDDGVKLRLRIGLVRLDINGDGKAGEDESFWRIYERLNRGAGVDEVQAREFVIALDRADAEWLQGYCNLLMAVSDFVLAYDEHELFERVAHLWFARPKTPHDFLLDASESKPKADWWPGVLDFVAYVHLINFPVKDAGRLQHSWDHLRKMIAHSRVMWRLILAETDDDNEWIPSPRQTGVIPNVHFTDERVKAWGEFLDEADALLDGRKLIPFWRGDPGRGVNLKRFFNEPRPFDLVLWIQGTAATPYLEKGELTEPETWQRFQRVFQGDFVGIALWVN